MKVSNFSIEPALCVPGDEITLSFTVKAESGDTIGENGLYVWIGVSDASETAAYMDPAFTISKGNSKTVSVKTRLLSSDYSFARGTVLQDFGVQLGLFGSRTNIVFPITMLDAWYYPSISLFQLERASGSVPDDEGESLLADVLLGRANAASGGNMGLRLYYKSGSMPTIASPSVDISNLIPTLLAGVNNAYGLIAKTFSKAYDWYFLLVFGDDYESAQSGCMVARAFANMHLSGASTGGVCFGGFSGATAGNPLMESYYPARFYGGVEEIGDGWTYLAPLAGATPGEHGGGLLRCRAIENKRIIDGSLMVQPSDQSIPLARLPDGYMPSGAVFSINACSGSRIARIGVGDADADYPGMLMLSWVRDLSDGDLYTGSAIWVQCSMEYWVD